MRFLEYYENAKKEIDETIEEIILSTEDEKLKEVFRYALKGGKRFRPTLCLLCCDALNGDRDKAKKYAAIIEFIHSASLIADDVIDNDVIRRNLPCLWKVATKIVSGLNKASLALRGKPVTTKDLSLAILTSDGLLAKALTLLESPEAVRAVSDGIYALLLGAVREVRFLKDQTEELYFEIVSMKTAALFATACFLGALSAEDAKEKEKEACRQYGKNLGILYQLLDDYIDDEIPDFIRRNPEKYFERYLERCYENVDSLPESKYKDAMKDAVITILQKFSKEAKKKKRKVIKNLLDSIKTNS